MIILLGSVIGFVITVFAYLYWQFRKSREYFDQNGIPYCKPTPLLGNIGPVLWENKPLPVLNSELYKKMEPHKYCGYFQFNRAFIMIRDPELIRNVLVKDFAYFSDRAIPINPKVDRISNNLLTMKGEEWKNHRLKLTSTFTSGKMKIMFPLVKKCGDKCAEVLQTLCGKPFNVKELSSRYTCDVIGTCAFGIETHSLDDPNSEFLKMGNQVFQFRYRYLLAGAFPNLPERIAELFNIRFVDVAVQNFFVSIIENTVKYREENKVVRNDFIDLLLCLKHETLGKYHDQHEQQEINEFLSQIGDKHSKSKIDMSSDTMAAQCFIFFAAGFETSSTALGFLMLELALHQDIQNKVRDEVNTIIAKNPEGFTYELLREMPYVDMVISELLRKYPATGFLLRECSEDYTIPDTNVKILKNTPVTVPIYGIHKDAKYYERPEQFYPEHFTKEAISKRPHYTYLPFGEGPRGCIGERFAKMQMKIGLISMIRDFKFEPCSMTILPVQFQQHFILLKAKSEIWLQCKKI